MHLGIISSLTFAMIVLSIVGYVQTSDCTGSQFVRLLERNSKCLKVMKQEIKNKSTKEKIAIYCNRSVAERMLRVCYNRCYGTCCFTSEEVVMGLSKAVDPLMEKCELNKYKDKIGTGKCYQYELDMVDRQVKRCEKDKKGSLKTAQQQMQWICSR